MKEEIREDEQKLEKKASPVDTVVVRFNSNFDLTVNFPLNRAATVRADEDWFSLSLHIVLISTYIIIHIHQNKYIVEVHLLIN